MKYSLFIPLLFVLTFVGCVKRDLGKIFEDKYDGRLKVLMKDPEFLQKNETMFFILELDKNLDFILKDKLESVGLKVLTSSGTILVAEAKPLDIKKAVRYDFVVKVSISKEGRFKKLE